MIFFCFYNKLVWKVFHPYHWLWGRWHSVLLSSLSFLLFVSPIFKSSPLVVISLSFWWEVFVVVVIDHFVCESFCSFYNLHLKLVFPSGAYVQSWVRSFCVSCGLNAWKMNMRRKLNICWRFLFMSVIFHVG